MWQILLIAGLYMFRGQIFKVLAPVASKLTPFLPTTTPQKNNFYGHIVMLLGGVVYVLPIQFVGLAWLSRLGYITSLWSTIITCALSIKVNYGPPPIPQITGFSMAAIQQVMPTVQPWLMQTTQSVEFHFMFFSLIFVLTNSSIFAVLILGRRSFWSVCTYCARNESTQGRLWLIVKPRWEKLKAVEQEVLQQSALAEILLGFWLAVNIFLSRQMNTIVTCFLYWTYLKIRFQAPKSAVHHVKAWRQIESTAQPLLRVAPFLSKPIDMAKEFFKPKYQVR